MWRRFFHNFFFSFFVLFFISISGWVQPQCLSIYIYEWEIVCTNLKANTILMPFLRLRLISFDYLKICYFSVWSFLLQYSFFLCSSLSSLPLSFRFDVCFSQCFRLTFSSWICMFFLLLLFLLFFFFLINRNFVMVRCVCRVSFAAVLHSASVPPNESFFPRDWSQSSICIEPGYWVYYTRSKRVRKSEKKKRFRTAR